MLDAIIVTRDSLIDIDTRSRNNPARHRKGSTDGGIRAQSTQTPSTKCHFIKPRSTGAAARTKSHRPCRIPDANGSIIGLVKRDHAGNPVSSRYCIQ